MRKLLAPALNVAVLAALGASRVVGSLRIMRLKGGARPRATPILQAGSSAKTGKLGCIVRRAGLTNTTCIAR